MNCAEARERLLEADPAELRGTVESPLSRHLTGCAVCAGLARHILAQTAAIHAALDHAPAVRPAKRWRRALPAGLAAAAVLAVLLIRRIDVTETAPGAPHVDEATSALVVTGANAAVMPTTNPKITVIWYFQEKP